MRSLGRLLALLALGATLVGCETEVAPPTGQQRDVPPSRGGVLRTATFVNLRTLDAAVAFDTLASAIEGLIYDRLVTYAPDSTDVVPELAESVDVSNDGLVYTFTLRRGVRFHDGKELRAKDVSRSIHRAFHVDTPCPVASYYDMIAGQKAYRGGKAASITGVRVEGDYVVVIELERPSSVFLHLMTLPIVAPLCTNAGERYDRTFSTHACGTGPFRLDRYEHGRVVRVVRHDGYWQKGLPYLDAVEWLLSMQQYSQEAKLEDGDLDYMREFTLAGSIHFRSSPAWRGLGEWERPLLTFGIFMNTEMDPFDDVHVRRAVSLAIDRDQLAMILPGHIVPRGKIVPEALIAASPGYPRQEHDLAAALDEMRLAGLPFDPTSGDGGYPGRIRYLALGDSFGQQAAEIFQQQLARIGIRIDLDLVSWPTFLAKTGRRRTVRMGTGGWHADYPEPSTFFEPILTTKAIDDETSQNNAFFSNEELDRITARATRTTNAAERARLYRRAEEIVVEEAPWAFTHARRYYELWQPYVHGYRPHPVLSQHVRGAWIDAAQQQLAAASRGRGCWQPAPGATRCATGHARDRVARTTLALVTGVR